MYIHIGGDYTISSHLIIGVFDMERVTVDPEMNATMDVLRLAEEQSRLDIISMDIPRSMILTLEKVYLSPVSTATLRTRLNSVTLAFDS